MLEDTLYDMRMRSLANLFTGMAASIITLIAIIIAIGVTK